MLTTLYIEALLIDEDLADQVWEAWDAGEIDDELATVVWLLLASWASAYGRALCKKRNHLKTCYHRWSMEKRGSSMV